MQRALRHMAPCLALTLAALACGQRASIVTGTVSGSDGAPLAVGHVSALAVGDLTGPATVVEVGAGGRYTLRTTATGIVPLVASSLWREPLRVPLFIGKPGSTVRLDFRLGPLHYADDLSHVAVIGDFNSFRRGQAAVPMERRPDGRFVAQIQGVTGETLTYQLINLSAPVEEINSTHPGPAVAGTDAERYVLRDGVGYAAVIAAKGGVATVVLDPTKLERGTGDPSWAVGAGAADTVSFAAFAHAMEQALGDYTRQRLDLNERGAAPPEVAKFVAGYDWTRFHAPIREVLKGDASPLFKQAAMVLYIGTLGETSEMSHCELDPAIAQRALEQVPPASPLWAAVPEAFPALTWANHVHALVGYGGYFERLVATHPDPGLREHALSYDLSVAYYDEDRGRAKRDYERLLADFPDSEAAASARTLLAPDKRVVEGAPVPAFRIASLDDPATVYSNENLKGRVLLIDFWGTWCGPCMGEMPYLQQAFEKYRDRGFTILSLSCDETPDAVREFRRTRWSMPWLHGFLANCYGDRSDNPLVAAFEVVGFPSTFLIDRDGTIVATGPALRGARLDATLAQLFARESARASR